MGNCSSLSPFLTVRPKGPDLNVPATGLRKTNRSRAPMDEPIRALDSTGRPSVSLAPRTVGAITIESREASAASVVKRQKISKGGTK